MEISDVRIRKLDTDSKLQAVASMTIDNELVIHDIKIIDGPHGLFVDMPSKRSGSGQYRDIVHPINSTARSLIEKTLLEAYNNNSK